MSPLLIIIIAISTIGAVLSIVFTMLFALKDDIEDIRNEIKESKK